MAISLTRVETPRRKWSALRPLQNHRSGNRDDGIFVEKFHQRPKKSWRQDHIGVQKEKIPAAKVFPVLIVCPPVSDILPIPGDMGHSASGEHTARLVGAGIINQEEFREDSFLFWQGCEEGCEEILESYA
jgi:hypothetical protein